LPFFYFDLKNFEKFKEYILKLKINAPNLAFIAFLTAFVSISEPALLPANVSEHGLSDAPVTIH
jgi:hypothetical protein